MLKRERVSVLEMGKKEGREGKDKEDEGGGEEEEENERRRTRRGEGGGGEIEEGKR